MSRRESLAEIEREADAQRLALSTSLAQVRLQLQPAALASEAGDRFKAAAVDALHHTTEKARTPTGLWTAAAAVAISVAILASRLQQTGRAPKIIEAPIAKDELAKVSSVSPRGDAGYAKAIAAMIAALAAGGLLAKLIPPLAREDEVLGGARAELQTALADWARRQVRQVSQPQADEPLRLTNAIALCMGLLLTRVGAPSEESRDEAAIRSKSET